MATGSILNYNYYFEGSSEYTLLGISGSSGDLKSDIGKEYFSLERITRIKKHSKNRRFNLLAVSGERVSGQKMMMMTKDQMKMRVAEFKEFFDRVTTKFKINPNKVILVSISDSALFTFNLALTYPFLFNNIVLINPSQDFYFAANKFYSILYGDKKIPLSNTNLFIYHREPRWKFNLYKPAEVKLAQTSFINKMIDERLARGFFVHFKNEDINDYKTYMLKFFEKSFVGQTDGFLQKPKLRAA